MRAYIFSSSSALFVTCQVSPISEYRYELILKRVFLRVSEDNYDDVALDRIGIDSFKDESDAWNEYLRAKEEVGFIPCDEDL